MSEKNPLKVLIIGSEGHGPDVAAHSWADIPGDLNLADFHRVVINLVPLETDTYAESLDIDRIPNFERFARLVLSVSQQVVVIGGPIKKVGTNLGFNDYPWWLPYYPQFHSETGSEYEVKDDTYQFWFDHVKRWKFGLRTGNWNPSPAMQAFLHLAEQYHTHRIEPEIRTLAENLFGLPIAFHFQYSLFNTSNVKLTTIGNVTWLPATTTLNNHDALDLLIERLFGISIVATKPNWLSDHQLPQETKILAEIETVENEIADLKAKLEERNLEFERETEIKKILYEEGEYNLAPQVRKALATLGGDVQEPTDLVRDDGRLKGPNGIEYTLEIKGRTGTLKEADVRELDQWVRDSRDDEGRESKGLLVVNLKRTEDPRNRTNIFPDNAVKSAINRGLVIVTTTQLFFALQQVQSGEFSKNEFWGKLQAEVGVSSLPTI